MISLSLRNKIWTTAKDLSLVALGYYTAKVILIVARGYIKTRWFKPLLVFKTSRWSALYDIRYEGPMPQGKPSDPLSGVIIAPKLEERLREVVTATKNITEKGGIYRNILMHGPPGTGKTLFAKKLALHSGMDYALVNGRYLPIGCGKDSVPYLHEMFDWAETSRKGLLLFIDDADAFLGERSSEHSSEERRAILDAFLCRTEKRSNRVMLVLASMVPNEFNKAVKYRVDETFEFQLPSVEERARLICLYFDEFVPQSTTNDMGRLAQLDYGALCIKMAGIAEGLSCRDLLFMKGIWRIAASDFADGNLTEKELIDKCLESIVRRKKFRYGVYDPRSYSRRSHANEKTNPCTRTY